MCKVPCPSPVPGGGCLPHHFPTSAQRILETRVWEPAASTLAAEHGECAGTTATGMVSVPCGSQGCLTMGPPTVSWLPRAQPISFLGSLFLRASTSVHIPKSPGIDLWPTRGLPTSVQLRIYDLGPVLAVKGGWDDSVQCTEALWMRRLFCTPSLPSAQVFLSQTPYSGLMERKMLRGLSGQKPQRPTTFLHFPGGLNY